MPSPSSKTSNRSSMNSRRIVGSLLLVLVFLILSAKALLATVLAAVSDDVIQQILSQTEVAVPNNNATTAAVVRKTTAAAEALSPKSVTLRESYGYIYLQDDSSINTFWNINHAAFYEYKLPRAILTKSQYNPDITPEESEQLLYMSGFMKQPWGWEPNPNRNVFVDEPYRDNRMDRIFKMSHGLLVCSILVGFSLVLAFLWLLGFLVWRRNNSCGRKRPTKSSSDSSSDDSSTFGWCSYYHAMERVWSNYELQPPETRQRIVTRALSVLLATILLAGFLARLSINLLSNSTRLCDKRCASTWKDGNTDEITMEFRFDACIEGCVFGTGGSRAHVGANHWFLAGGLVGVITVLQELAATRG